MIAFLCAQFCTFSLFSILTLWQLTFLFVQMLHMLARDVRPLINLTISRVSFLFEPTFAYIRCDVCFHTLIFIIFSMLIACCFLYSWCLCLHWKTIYPRTGCLFLGLGPCRRRHRNLWCFFFDYRVNLLMLLFVAYRRLLHWIRLGADLEIMSGPIPNRTLAFLDLPTSQSVK